MLIETPAGADYTAAECAERMRQAGFKATPAGHLAGPECMVVGIKSPMWCARVPKTHMLAHEIAASYCAQPPLTGNASCSGISQSIIGGMALLT
jgi:hypothetical protein